jgi:predicted amidohydrolase
MRVAAVQMMPVLKDHLGNLRKASLLALQAAKKGAQLIVLPELLTSGYSLMSTAEALEFAEVLTEFNATELPQHISDAPFPNSGPCACPSQVVFHAIAAEFNAYIAWGLVEKDAGTGQLYNSQVLMAPDGTWESYRKLNLFGNDFLWAKAGRANPPVARTPIGKIGLLVCRDVRDKSDKLDSFYEKGDADVVAFSANWGKGGFPAVHWMDFAKDNKVTLVVANRYGIEAHNDFGLGGSCIVFADGRVSIDGLQWGADCIVMGDT